MKKLLAFILSVIMLLMSVSCKTKKTDENEDDAGIWALNTETNISGIDGTIYALFEAAQGEDDGSLYPVFYLGSRVMSYAEYAFLCAETDEKADTVSLFVSFVKLEGESAPEITNKVPVTLSGLSSQDGELYFGDKDGDNGWTLNIGATEGEFPELVKAVCDKAFAGQDKYFYTPVSYLGSRVGEGENFLIICNVSRLKDDFAETLALVTVSADLDGNASILRESEIDISKFQN